MCFATWSPKESFFIYAQIQWFWLALRSFNCVTRAKFFQFVTGTSRVPSEGFCALQGMNGVERFRISYWDCSLEHLPLADTWYFEFFENFII